jgi:glyoxylase-like metal-dependent hydrolase (beta-lactamase superfamily II)
VPYYLHPADSAYPYDGTPGNLVFQAIGEGDVLTVGGASLEVCHTPGHTDGSVSFIMDDRAAFTGDFIFIESIGRPDLGERAKEWAVKLWASVKKARREWDPNLAVYPAHYTSELARRPDRSVGGSLDQIWRENPVLQIREESAFVDFILENEATFPDAYRKIKALNVGLSPIILDEIGGLEVGRNECGLGGN